jgi:hypothetical protein
MRAAQRIIATTPPQLPMEKLADGSHLIGLHEGGCPRVSTFLQEMNTLDG